MAFNKLPGTGTLFDKKDEEQAIAIREALGPLLQSKMSSGPNLPSCPIEGLQHFLTPDQMVYYYDSVRNLWLSQEMLTFQFGRRGSVGNNVLLRTTDAMPTNLTGVPIPFDGETLVWGVAADWSNTVVTANFQVQANGFATIATLNTNGVNKEEDLTLSGQIPAGLDYLTVRTNGLSANVVRPEVTVYVRRFKIPV